MFLGQPVYVLPGEDLKSRIAAEGFKDQDRITAGEEPYGAPSQKLRPKTLADPIIIQTTTVEHSHTQPQTSNPKPEHRNQSSNTSMSFDANNKEKVFVLIVLITVLTYIYFKFFQ